MEPNDTTLITIAQDITRLEAERESIAKTVKELRKDIEALRQQVRQGDDVKSSEAGKAMSDVRYWLKALRETETELETHRRKNAGITGSYGLDLDAARHSIGCRLARLRPCCQSG